MILISALWCCRYSGMGNSAAVAAGKFTEARQVMNIQKWSLQVAAATLVLAILAVAFLSFSWSRQEAIEQLQSGAEQRASHFSLSVFAPTDKYAYLPHFVSNYPAVVDALLRPQDPTRIRKANLLLERLNAEAGAAVIYILDLDGLTIASSNWKEAQSFVGKNYAFRPYFIDALRKGRGRFYGLGVTTHVPGYFISYPVRKGKTIVGVAAVKVDIHDIATDWTRGEHDVVVTDENGVVFLSSRDAWKYRPMQPLTDEVRKRLQKTRQYEAVLQEPLSIEVEQALSPDKRIVTIEVKDQGATERASYFVKSRKVPASDWTIHVVTSMRKIDLEARRTAVLVVAMIALLLLSSMYLVQARYRNKERKESQRALKEALQALEAEHSALQAVTEELRHASSTDSLTGAYNRRFFLETTRKMVSAANRHQLPLSVIVIDVDHFKKINDEYGHPAGDKVLQVLSSTYRNALRDDDIFARFGGEEFVMALPNTDEETARQVAERLREQIMNQSIEIDGHSLTVTVSSGVSRHWLNEKAIQAAIKRADDALYEAKESGRNRVIVR